MMFVSGLSVFLQYKEGSSRQGKGSAKYKVPDMRWVGLRPSQLNDLDLPEQVSSEQIHVILEMEYYRYKHLNPCGWFDTLL